MKIKYLFLLFLFNLFPINVIALETPTLYSEKAIVYDLDDKQVLFKQNENEQANIASLTKVITTIVAIENIDNLDDEVTITSEMMSLVRWDASVAGLKINDKVTYRDLLYASILPSGADATNSLAILISGSVENYVKLMNELVNKLGLSNTHFANVTGLDEDGHYSSASDLQVIIAYCLENPLFKEIYTTREYKLSNGLLVKSTIVKASEVGDINISRILGSKTGFTLGAGLCISALINSNDHNILLITLNAPYKGDYYNIKDAIYLASYLDSNYDKQVLINKDEIVKKINVKYSNIEEYNIKINSKIEKYLANDYNKDNFKVIYDGLETISYKNHQGDKIGTLKVYYLDELLYEEDVILDGNITINKYIIISIIGILLVGMIIIIIIIKK